MRGRELGSFAVMAAFMAMNAGTSKPKPDETPVDSAAIATAIATASAPTTASAPSATASASASATPEADAPKPPNKDHSCDTHNDTTCEFNERCNAGDGKKRTNGFGQCVIGCPKGLAPGPGGCGKKCSTDKDCAREDGKRCVLVKEPPRGMICQR
jgi:hypothetical protein